MAILLLLFLYAICVFAIAGLARLISRAIPLALLLVFSLVPILFFSPGLLTGKTPLPLDQFRVPPWGTTPYAGHYNPYLDDVVKQFLPWAEAVRLAWGEGSLPLRNRWNGCGMALAANGSSAAFSPLTLLALPLPPVVSLLFLAAVKILLALSGTWLWLKELRLRDGPALFGAVAFGISLSMTAWIFFPQTAALALWPWALFAVEALPDREVGKRAFWLLIGVFTFWPLAGHIETVALGSAFIGLWLLARILARDLPEPRRTIGRVTLAAAAALGLSAFFLVPHALAIGASNRRALAEIPFWSSLTDWMPHAAKWSSAVITLFYPRALGDGIASPMLEAAGAGPFPEMALGHIGIIAWAAAFLVIRPGAPRRRATWALLATLLFGLGAATLLWPFGETIGILPGLRFVFPLRFLSWVALAGAALAAFELDRLERDLEASRTGAAIAPIGVAAALAVFGIVAFLRFRAAHSGTGGLATQTRALTVALVALAVFSALPLLLRRVQVKWPLFRHGLAAALALVCAAELFYQGRRLYRFRHFEQTPADSPLLSALRSRRGPFRVLGDDYLLYPNTNVLARLEEVRTHDPVERREYVALLDAAAGYPPADYFKQVRDVNAPIFDFLNVRYFIGRPGTEAPGGKWRNVYAGPEGTLFENTKALPRVVADPAAEILDYVERTNSITFRVRGTEPTRVRTSVVQDGGWRARSDGIPIRANRAHGPFLTLEVPGGSHTVRLRYLPPGMAAGFGITAAAIVIVGIAVFRRASSRPKTP